MLGCGGRRGRCGKRYERRRRKVCWGVKEVRGDVGKGEGNEVREEMWEEVAMRSSANETFLVLI